jgi:small subunit ribosomal protein S9
MADEETPETSETSETKTPAEETPAAHAVPTEEAEEIAGAAEDAPLEALQEASDEHGKAEPDEAEQFAPIAGNAVPTDEATEIAGVAEDAPLEAAQEAQELAEAEELAEVFEEVVAEEVAEKIVAEVVQEAVEAEIEEELVEAEVEAEVEAVEEIVAEEIAEEVVAETIEAEAEAEAELEEEEDLEEEPAPREKPAVPGAHLEVDIVPEGVDPLGRDTDSDPYASVAEAYEEVEVADGEGGPQEDEEAFAEPISSAAIDLASGARYRATGKRKTAIARVTLRPGTGTYLVNGRVLEEHFPRVTLQRNIRQPLETVGYQERMDVVARLHGGGISAQAGALRHGVSRALLEADPNLRGELKRRGFLTRDSRAKERKKAGLKKARKRPQFSKR